MRPQPQPRPQRREAYEDWDYDERVHSADAGKKIGIITGIIVAAILVLFYIIGLVMYHGKFLPKTYVNNVNISGMTEEEAVKRGYSLQVSRLPAAAIPRARTLQQIDGMMKAIVNAHTGRIIGCTLFCIDAPEVINLVSLAMKNDLHYSILRDFIFTHPSICLLYTSPSPRDRG